MLINNLHETKNDLLAFHLVTGFRIAIFDLQEKEIFSCPQEVCEFCKAIKENEKSAKLCNQCDKKAFYEANFTGKSHLYSCPFGLYEIVVPLLMDNQVTGYIMIGQMALNSPETSDKIRKVSAPFLQENDNINDIIESIPRISLEKLYASLSLLEISANHIVKQGWLKPDKQTLAIKIKEYIDNQFTKNISIDMICEHVTYSRTYVIRAFTKEYNISISKYIEQKRLELAVELLKTTEKSVGQIALFCGFNDQYYFSKVFKKCYGKNPSKSRE